MRSTLKVKIVRSVGTADEADSTVPHTFLEVFYLEHLKVPMSTDTSADTDKVPIQMFELVILVLLLGLSSRHLMSARQSVMDGGE